MRAAQIDYRSSYLRKKSDTMLDQVTMIEVIGFLLQSYHLGIIEEMRLVLLL